MGVDRLPPANWRPYSLGSLGACSMRTFFQSTSSSSAIIIGRLVRMPWPISGFLDMIVTTPSGATRTKAFSAPTPAAWAPAFAAMAKFRVRPAAVTLARISRRLAPVA